jgi:hypothetical protein
MCQQSLGRVAKHTGFRLDQHINPAATTIDEAVDRLDVERVICSFGPEFLLCQACVYLAEAEGRSIRWCFDAARCVTLEPQKLY